MIMVETKTDSLADGASGLGVELPDLDVEFVDPPDMTPELFDELEAEILSVFPREQILTPDDVRGDADTLESAVLDQGWPTIGETRGKVLFALVDTGPSSDVYTEGAPSLEDRILFTSATPGEPDAAFVRVDDSIEDGDDLDQWAESGYLIRTRTDVPAIHAVEDDTTAARLGARLGSALPVDRLLPRRPCGRHQLHRRAPRRRGGPLQPGDRSVVVHRRARRPRRVTPSPRRRRPAARGWSVTRSMRPHRRR